MLHLRGLKGTLGDLLGSKETGVDFKGPYNDFLGSKRTSGQHIGTLRDSMGLSGNQWGPREDLRGPIVDLRGLRGT